MRVRLRPAIVCFTTIGLLTACGDDGNDQPLAGETIEVAVLSGGDQAAEEEATVADPHEDMGREVHDEMVDDGHEAMVPDDHKGTIVDDGHGEMASDGHDEAMVHDDVGAMGGDAHEMADDDRDETAETGGDGTADDHDEGVAADDQPARGDDGTASATGLVVEVEMVEFGFVAEPITLPVGEPITFRFTNTGVVPHEAMFGTRHQQEEFAEAGDHGDGHGDAGHHGDVAAITLDAGEAGDIVVEFGTPGEVWIGCHLPGHYEAGMWSVFTVG